MESSAVIEVVNALAEKVGIAVESTSQFLEEILPQYALMEGIRNLIYGGVMILVCIAIVVIATIAISKYAKNNIYWEDAALVAMVPCGLGICLGLFGVIKVVNGILWLTTPQAMFFKMLLEVMTA